MDKYAVSEELNEKMEKYASSGCPNCGATPEVHGNVVMCPRCGTEPFESQKERKR